MAELRPLSNSPFVKTTELLHDLRGVPPIDLADLRAEADELFGADEVAVHLE